MQMREKKWDFCRELHPCKLSVLTYMISTTARKNGISCGQMSQRAYGRHKLPKRGEKFQTYYKGSRV